MNNDSKHSKKKVCILGAGVGGLVVAHELSKYDHFDIHIIDRNMEVGGQARSALDDGKHSEYCWHAISSGYGNLSRIYSEIPFGKEEKTVLDNLKPMEKYHFFTERGDVEDFNLNFLTDLKKFRKVLSKITGKYHILDTIKLFFFYLKIQCLSEKRVKDRYYDYTTWESYIPNISEEAKRWVVDSTSIYLGMEYNEINAHLMMDLMRHSSDKGPYLSDDYSFYCFNGPINERWYDPWVKYLESKGVKFYINHTIKNINKTYSNEVDKVTIQDNWSKDIKDIEQIDIAVNGLSVESLAELYPVSYNSFHTLAGASAQVQTQILYYLNFRLESDKFNTVQIFHESPWFIMSRLEGNLWDLPYDLVSCGIGIWNKPGLNGKTAMECTPEEMAIECWNQMRKFNKEFPEKISEWDIWDTFQYNPHTKDLGTTEPKFSNNINTYYLRPRYKDSTLKNFYHATAYAKTTMNVFNMESAAEAGVEVAKLISKDDKVKVYKSDGVGWFFGFFRWLDGFLYKFKRCKD